jgi:cobalamin-dependent methionine synthase I
MSDLLLIGERCNTHRPAFARRVAERDAAGVAREVDRQIAAGVTHLDINATSDARERESLLWIVETILPRLTPDVKLVLNASVPQVAADALLRTGRRAGTVLNGITLDAPERDGLLKLAVEQGCEAIAILARAGGPARSADERLALAEELVACLKERGLSEERILLDPQVLPVAFDPQQPRSVLEAVRAMRQRWPRIRIVAGLSNVSFNMPDRSLLNRTFLAMLLQAGVQGLIFDPCDGDLQDVLTASRALMGQDDFLAGYLARIKEVD